MSIRKRRISIAVSTGLLMTTSVVAGAAFYGGSALSHWVAAPRGPVQTFEHGHLPKRHGGLGSRTSPSVAVWGQERGQRRQHLVGSLLGDPVPAVGNDQGLHVVRGEPHRVPDPLTAACRSTDRQHGQGQAPGL